MPANWVDLKREKDLLVANVMKELSEPERQVLIFLLKTEMEQRERTHARVKRPLREKIEETIR